MAAVVLCVNLLRMLHFRWKILPLLLPIIGCVNKNSIDNHVVVNASQVILRIEPSEKSQEITTLNQGQVLIDLGEVGPAESQIALGEEVFQTPWVKVQTPENQSGWVLAWALKANGKQGDWLLQKRLVCYFGKSLTLRRNTVVQSFASLETEAKMAQLWQESNTLRDTFLKLLAQRPEAGFPLQFNWLNEALPGFLFQKIGENEGPHLFADFQIWQHIALKTNGLQDDAFFQTCLSAFPLDSIESFFPVWKFQLAESESASQLGTGQHVKLFRQMDQVLETGMLFKHPLEIFKEQILEDIFEKKQRYWQPQEKILAELDQILADPPKCLNTRDREALGIRYKMFEDPEGNGLRVNLRSGE